MALGTLSTFAFYQWTQTCTSGLTDFLSASIVAIILLTLTIVSLFILRMSTRKYTLQRLYSKDYTYLHRWGSLYDTLKEGPMYFAVVLWTIILVRSGIIGFGQGNGLAQVVALIVVDLVICISECLSS